MPVDRLCISGSVCAGTNPAPFRSAKTRSPTQYGSRLRRLDSRWRSPDGDQKWALRVCEWQNPPARPQEAFGAAEPSVTAEAPKPAHSPPERLCHRAERGGVMMPSLRDCESRRRGGADPSDGLGPRRGRGKSGAGFPVAVQALDQTLDRPAAEVQPSRVRPFGSEIRAIWGRCSRKNRSWQLIWGWLSRSVGSCGAAYGLR